MPYIYINITLNYVYVGMNIFSRIITTIRYAKIGVIISQENRKYMCYNLKSNMLAYNSCSHYLDNSII